LLIPPSNAYRLLIFAVRLEHKQTTPL